MTYLITAWTIGGLFAAGYAYLAVIAWRRHRRQRTGGNSR